MHRIGAVYAHIIPEGGLLQCEMSTLARSCSSHSDSTNKPSPPSLPSRHDVNVRQDIITTCLKMQALGINQGTSGNVSARCEGGFLVTPSGLPYETMQPSQIVFMDSEGGYYGQFLPSSEWRLHCDIYKQFPDAGAVVHAHPTYCTALACQRRDIPAFHYMVAAAGGASIRCADYATFGTQELSEKIIAALCGGRKACLMANHGVIVYGLNLSKALGLAVEVEVLAKEYLESCRLGPPHLLADEEMERILIKFKTYGKQTHELTALSIHERSHAVIPPPKRD